MKFENINVLDIIKKYLKENGYDGLCSEYLECGCKIDDLMPCENVELDCKPSYRHVYGENTTKEIKKGDKKRR